MPRPLGSKSRPRDETEEISAGSKRAREGKRNTPRGNAVMHVTKNMRPGTDSLIMGAAINKPAEELGREGR